MNASNLFSNKFTEVTMKCFFKKAMLVTVLSQGLLVGIANANETEIPVLGISQKGEEIEIPMKSRFFKKRLKKALTAINGEAIPSLNKTIRSEQKWTVSQVDLGVSLGLALGLGDLIKGSIGTELKLAFKRRK